MKRSLLIAFSFVICGSMLLMGSSSLSYAQDCIDVGTFVCTPSVGNCRLDFGLAVCEAYVSPPPNPANLLYIWIGTWRFGAGSLCTPDLWCWVDCSDSTITAEFDPNRAVSRVGDYDIYIKTFSGKLLSSHSFRVSLTYELDCIAEHTTCYFLGGDCTGSHTFEGVIIDVPVKQTTWGHVKAMYE